MTAVRRSSIRWPAAARSLYVLAAATALVIALLLTGPGVDAARGLQVGRRPARVRAPQSGTRASLVYSGAR